MDHPPTRWSALWRTRLLKALLALVLTCAVILVSFQGYRAAHEGLRQSALDKRASISHLSAALLTERFDRLVDVGNSLATRVRFRALVAAGEWEAAGSILAEVPRDFGYIDRLFLTTPDGMLMVDAPALPDVRGRDFAHRGWYQGVSREWRPYVSNVYQRAAVPQIRVFAVAVPITGHEGDVAGILVLQISLDTFFEWTRLVDMGAHGMIYVVDRAGTVAFHQRHDVQQNPVDLSAHPAVQRLLLGYSGTEIVHDEASRQDYVTAYGPLAGYGWGLVITEPAREVFAAKTLLLRRVLVSDALIILLVFSALYMAFRIKAQRDQARLDRRVKAELEAEVARRTALLEEANKELEGFSYSVSHDLRAPLRAIDGFSMALEEDCADGLDAQGRQYLTRIRDNARRMGDLIDDILRFSRLGRTAVRPTWVDMEALVREIVGELRAHGGAGDVDFTLHPLPRAWCDPALIRHVWENLLSNAVKFSGGEGAPRVEIGCVEADGEPVYFVRDNGAGFDMQYYDKLFGVFQRLHGMDDFPGTGVGLAIVRRVVAGHAGRVWAEAEVGKGASFYFSLPAGG